jgi:hypothetical protein
MVESTVRRIAAPLEMESGNDWISDNSAIRYGDGELITSGVYEHTSGARLKNGMVFAWKKNVWSVESGGEGE